MEVIVVILFFQILLLYSKLADYVAIHVLYNS